MASYRILIIDDELSICSGCQMVLEDGGHRVDACQNGRQGLEALLSGAYDLALLDIHLPDINGMEILQRVASEQPEVCIIVMTGYSSVKNAVEAIKLGAFDYLTKPFSDDELSAAVHTALENKRLKQENRTLRRRLNETYDFDAIVGENPRILKIFDDIRKVAPTDTTVLLSGESGTGKELFARAIHTHSRRAAHPLVAADCSAFSESLLESELFGHVRGAFTGAVRDKAGIFEAADKGTLFLDEVANLSADIQAKLLRAIESREFKPVGASRAKSADVRIIAATNRDLQVMVGRGEFREDLFYRLNVFPLLLPPLRERRDDIPRLLYHFLKLFCRRTGKRIDGFSDEALRMLVDYDWPGNVRQLRNVVERLTIMAEGRILEYRYFSDTWHTDRTEAADPVPATLDALKEVKQRLLQERFGQVEKAFLSRALTAAGGNITQAAKQVGMQRSNFSALMKKHGLTAEAAAETDPEQAS
jgi:two-component system NtrC family response regulator